MAQDVNDILSKWIIKGENDLRTADQLLKIDEPITDSICFHCQQAAEKYLKAYLISQGITPEKTHKIERLIEAAARIDPSFIDLKEAVLLTEYAVEARYADGFYIPSVNEAKDAFVLSLKVKEFILKRIK